MNINGDTNVSELPLLRLWRALSEKRRFQCVGLIILMIFGAAAELVSIGASIPFIGVLTDPNIVHAELSNRFDLELLPITSESDLRIFICIIFATLAVVTALIRIWLLRTSTRLAFKIGADIGQEVYRKTLYQAYDYHISSNSSVVSDAIIAKTQTIINGILYPLMHLASAAVMVGIISCALIYLEPNVTIISLSIFSMLYVCVYLVTRQKLFNAGQSEAKQSALRVKHIQEGLGGIRDVILCRHQELYFSIFKRADDALRMSQARILVLTQSPRFLIEAIGMVLVAGLAVAISGGAGGVTSALPTLGALAMAAQRLLPMLQQVYGGSASLKGNKATLLEILTLLERPSTPMQQTAAKVLQFQKEIRFENVSFSYKGRSKKVLDDVNITIPKGSRVGIVGKTGSGKSTFLDILMGLLSPTQGAVFVDDKPLNITNVEEWQAIVSHVPQTIFLNDASIAENIALGVDPYFIDRARLTWCAQLADLEEVVAALPLGYSTVIGERGVMLSGGQRQRVGIARALYRSSEVMTLDEATSALDPETERRVLEALMEKASNVTVFSIAHREEVLRHCDLIIRIEDGRANIHRITSC